MPRELYKQLKSTGRIKISGKWVHTEFSEFITKNSSILAVEVGTTGFCDGFNKHGTRGYLRLSELYKSDKMRCYPTEHFTIEVKGDEELQALLYGLEFAVDKLKSEIERREEINERRANGASRLSEGGDSWQE